MRGDFGTTISDNRPVTEILTWITALPPSNLSCTRSLWRSLSVPLGMVAARFRDRWPDAVLRVFAILGYATPVFFMGLLLKLIFSVNLGIFPIAGRASSQGELEMSRITNPTGIYLLDALRLGDMQLVGDVLLHAVLPAIALGMLTGGVFLRLVRTNLWNLEQPYISRRARAGRRPACLAHLRPRSPRHHRHGHADRHEPGRRGSHRDHLRMGGPRFCHGPVHGLARLRGGAGIVMMIAVIVAVISFLVDVIAASLTRVRY